MMFNLRRILALECCDIFPGARGLMQVFSAGQLFPHYSWTMLLMSHESACKGCCGLCILHLAINHTTNLFHSVTVPVSLEGRKGWVHLLRAEYSPTCYRPVTAEINQCSFLFLGSSVKKTNTKKRGRYSHPKQKSIAEAKILTWHQLVSNKLAVF